MRLPELNKKQMAIIYILVFLISGLLLYKFVVSSELKRYRESVSRYHSQQQREMRQVSRRNTLIEHYKVLKETSNKTHKLLFTEREAEDFFLKKLPKLSHRMGNKLYSMLPQASKKIVQPKRGKPAAEEAPPQPEADVSKKPVPVTLKGEYGNMIKLFRALEGDQKLMAISNVGVSIGGEPGEVSVRFNLNLIHSGLNVNAPSEDVMSEIVANYEASKLVALAQATPQPSETAEEETAPEVEESDAKRGWFSSVLDFVLRRKPKAEVKPKPETETAEEEEIEMAENVPEPNQSGSEREKPTPRQSETVKTEPVKKVTKRYSVQVGVFEIESNVKELGDMLESKNLDPWIKPGLKTMTPPYYVFVGRFIKKEDAYKFGKVLMDELPWINEYTVKEVLLDYDSILRETHTLN